MAQVTPLYRVSCQLLFREYVLGIAEGPLFKVKMTALSKSHPCTQVSFAAFEKGIREENITVVL